MCKIILWKNLWLKISFEKMGAKRRLLYSFFFSFFFWGEGAGRSIEKPQLAFAYQHMDWDPILAIHINENFYYFGPLYLSTVDIIQGLKNLYPEKNYNEDIL